MNGIADNTSIGVGGAIITDLEIDGLNSNVDLMTLEDIQRNTYRGAMPVNLTGSIN